MSKPEAVSDADFEAKVLKASKPVLVDFWATWCRPCQMVAPIVDELSEKYTGRVDFCKIDVDKNPKYAGSFNVMSIPTIMIFKNGKPVSHMVGLRPKAEIERNVEAALNQK